MSRPPLIAQKWYEKLNFSQIILIIFVLLIFTSVPVLKGSEREISYFKNLITFLSYFYPPDFSITFPAIQALGETFQIAVLATFFSLLISIPLAACGAQNLASPFLTLPIRLLMNVIRTVPSLIWALMAVAIVGPTPLAGIIALTFYSVGYLGKFYSDAYEASNMEVVRALRATGANPIQAFQYGLWPQVKPLIWSYGLWMLEYNIRSAAIIGYVGAGGIGVQLHTYQEYYQWDRFATVLLLILFVVILLDFLGEKIRKKLTEN